MIDVSIADQFLSAIPGTTLWSDWWNSDVEFLPKLWWPLSEFLGYFFVISGILDTDSVRQTSRPLPVEPSPCRPSTPGAPIQRHLRDCATCFSSTRRPFHQMSHR